MNHEINDHTVTVIERCELSPPPGSVPSTNLPLTFFDIPWFYSPPIKRIFFYDFPFPTHHFMQTALPILKDSLSITLQHFFPFSANLIVPPHPHLPFIRYLDGDSLCFTVAESSANFTLLVSDSPQDIRNWHPLVATLAPARDEDDGTRVIPLMAVQVTVLPNSGFSISLTFNHLAADGKSLHHFVKYWASVCLSFSSSFHQEVEGSLSLPLPSHDRDVIIKDPKGLKLKFYRELQEFVSKMRESGGGRGLMRNVFVDKFRATFVLSREQVDKLKKFIALKCTNYESGKSHISTFVVTCSLIWVCMMKSNVENTEESDKLRYLVFLADCRDVSEFSIPSTYFGNCLVTCTVAKKRSELVREKGIIEAANAIEKEIRVLRSDALRKAENLMNGYKEFGMGDKSPLVIAGSPKLTVYETDFGWGKPKKSESAHVDSSGAISLCDCRDKEGAIAVGLALEKDRMNNFISILEEQLNNLTLT